MARTKEQNDRMSVATREKIMAAGLKLFSQKGFSMTGIKDIAQTAGISTGLIYRHFSSKDELFGGLIENTLMEMSRATHLLDTDISPTQTFEEFTLKLLNDIQSGEELTRYFLMITRAIWEEEASPRIAELKKKDLSLFDQAAGLIEKGQRLGEFKPGDPFKLSLLFFSFIQGIADMKLFMGEKYIAPEVQDIMAVLLK